MNVPPATISLHKASNSRFEPSTQWSESGLQRSAILSTQRRRCLFSASGVAGLRFFMKGVPQASHAGPGNSGAGPPEGQTGNSPAPVFNRDLIGAISGG